MKQTDYKSGFLGTRGLLAPTLELSAMILRAFRIGTGTGAENAAFLAHTKDWLTDTRGQDEKVNNPHVLHRNVLECSVTGREVSGVVC